MFQVEQKVVCVDDSNWEFGVGNINLPKLGNEYVIRAIGLTWPMYGERLWVLLEEIINPADRSYRAGEAAFKAERFRPLIERKTSIAVFEKILDGVSKKRTSQTTA